MGLYKILGRKEEAIDCIQRCWDRMLREGKLELGWFIMSSMPRDPCEKRWEDKRTLRVEKIGPGLREWSLPWRGNCGNRGWKGRLGPDYAALKSNGKLHWETLSKWQNEHKRLLLWLLLFLFPSLISLSTAENAKFPHQCFTERSFETFRLELETGLCIHAAVNLNFPIFKLGLITPTLQKCYGR